MTQPKPSESAAKPLIERMAEALVEAEGIVLDEGDLEFGGRIRSLIAEYRQPGAELGLSPREIAEQRAELLAACIDLRHELAACARDCMTEKQAMRWLDDNAADITARAAIARATKGRVQA